MALTCKNCDEPVKELMPGFTFFAGSHVILTRSFIHVDSGDKRCGYVGHWMETHAEVDECS